MTTQISPLTTESIYALPTLTEIFSAALERKQAIVGDFNRQYPNATWAAGWPGGNTNAEQFVVDWLKAQEQTGATRIITKNPIGGDSAFANSNHSLYLQIHNKHAYAA